MSRKLIPPFVLLAVAIVAGAAYLGTRSAGPAGPAPVVAPPTVPVSRGDVELTVSAPGTLVGTRQVTLAAGAAATLLSVDVRPGQAVLSGTVLARLDPVPLAAQLATARAALDVARAKLEKLRAGPSAADLAAAQLEVANAEAALARATAGPSAVDWAAARADAAAAQAKLDTLRAGPDPVAVQNARDALEMARNSLWSTQISRDAVCVEPSIMCDQAQAGVGNGEIAVRQAQAALDRLLAGPTATEVRLAELDVQRAKARLADLAKPADENTQAAAQLQKDRATAQLALLTAGTAAPDLAQAEAEVRSAEVAAAQAERALASAEVVAPFDGTVLDVKANAGDAVASGTPLIVMTDPAAVEAEVMVIEEDLPAVRIGQAVDVFFDAQPDAVVTGRVARIVPRRAASDRAVYAAYLALDKLPPSVLPGMTVDSSIVIEARENVLRLPRALVRAGAGGTVVVDVWTGTRVEARAVEVGLRGDVYVEIVSGLREGDQVVGQ